MSLSANAVRLAALHEQPAYRAERFDDGQPLPDHVAVLPSAFNPPTRAHLGLLELPLQEEGIEAAVALLSTNNVDKSLFGAPLSHKWLAVMATNAARLFDQGMALRFAFPKTKFDFVVGYDTLVRLFDSKYYEDMDAALDSFFAEHRVIATNRAQATTDTVRDYLEQSSVRRWALNVLVRQLPESHRWLSSTETREGIRQSAKAMALTDEVSTYIQRNDLYGEESETDTSAG